MGSLLPAFSEYLIEPEEEEWSLRTVSTEPYSPSANECNLSLGVPTAAN